jgi:hypothetical protein
VPVSRPLQRVAQAAIGRHCILDDRSLYPVPLHIHASGRVRGASLRSTDIGQSKGDTMRRQLAALLAGGAFLALSSAAIAHHSFAMFDQENRIELAGVVQEFKFTSPHSFILLQVKEQDGSTTVWNLEGNAPSNLVRDGWSSKTLKPGDEIELTVEPLRSGAPGGSWNANRVKFKGGKPIVVSH